MADTMVGRQRRRLGHHHRPRGRRRICLTTNRAFTIVERTDLVLAPAGNARLGPCCPSGRDSKRMGFRHRKFSAVVVDALGTQSSLLRCCPPRSLPAGRHVAEVHAARRRMARRAPARQNRLNSPSYDQLTRTRQSLGHRRPCGQIRPSTASLWPAQAPAIFHAIRRTPSAQYFRNAKKQSTFVSTPRTPRRLSQDLTMPEFCLTFSAMAASIRLRSMQRTWGTCGSCRRVDPNWAGFRAVGHWVRVSYSPYRSSE